MTRRVPGNYVFGTGPAAVAVIDAATAATLLQSRALQELVTKLASRTDDEAIANQLVALLNLRHEYTRGGHISVTETVAALPDSPCWFSTKTAAESLGMTPGALRQAVHRKQISATSVEGRLQFAAADLDLYRRNRRGDE